MYVENGLKAGYHIILPDVKEILLACYKIQGKKLCHCILSIANC